MRTSSARPRSAFDSLAASIEEKWYDAVNGGPPDEEGKNKGKRPGEVDQTDKDEDAKRLLVCLYCVVLCYVMFVCYVDHGALWPALPCGA